MPTTRSMLIAEHSCDLREKVVPDEVVVLPTTPTEILSLVEPPPSPGTIRYRKSKVKHDQRQAMKDIRVLIAANGGSLPYGALTNVVKKFQARGAVGVKEENLRYRLRRERSGIALLDEEVTTITTKPPVEEVDATDAATNTVSTITQPSAFRNEDGSNKENASPNKVPKKKVGGRPVGSTKKKKEKLTKRTSECFTEAALEYFKLKKEASLKGVKVEAGTLTKLIDSSIENNGLEPGSLNRETIKGRIHTGNYEGIQHQKVSPIVEAEPLIAEYCYRLAKIGAALTKDEVRMISLGTRYTLID